MPDIPLWLKVTFLFISLMGIIVLSVWLGKSEDRSQNDEKDHPWKYPIRRLQAPRPRKK